MQPYFYFVFGVSVALGRGSRRCALPIRSRCVAPRTSACRVHDATVSFFEAHQCQRNRRVEARIEIGFEIFFAARAIHSRWWSLLQERTPKEVDSKIHNTIVKTEKPCKSLAEITSKSLHRVDNLACGAQSPWSFGSLSSMSSSVHPSPPPSSFPSTLSPPLAPLPSSSFAGQAFAVWFVFSCGPLPQRPTHCVPSSRLVVTNLSSLP